MHEELENAIETGKITTEFAKALEELAPGRYCQHRSWGFGKVVERDLLMGQLIIDFEGKSGHAMQLEYAVESLTPIPPEHISAKIRDDRDGMLQMGKDDVTGFMKITLRSFGGSAEQDRVQQALVPALFETDADFRKWWANVKKVLKKDGHFTVPAKKSDPFVYREESISMAEELVQAFNGTNLLKSKLQVLSEVLKNLAIFKGEEIWLEELVTTVNELARQNQRINEAETVEFLLARDEIYEYDESFRKEEETLTVADMLLQFGGRLLEVVETIPAVRQKRLMKEFFGAFGDQAVDKLLGLMHRGSIRMATEVSRVLMKEHEAELRDALESWIRERTITTETLYWLCKERTKNLEDLVNPMLLNAILSSLERDQFNEKKSNKLQDLLLSDKKLMEDLVKSADEETARELMRAFLLSPVFEDLTKRSLLARMIRVHPKLQVMLEGKEAEHQDDGLIVSWSSLEARKNELEDLVNRRIPENSEDIKIAREYGDLRENHEYKSAKEMQVVLMRRKAELEVDLGRARGTGFESPDASQVSIGTTVRMKDLASGKEEVIHVLGAWDSDPDNKIIAYMTALGQVLLTKTVGDRVTIPGDQEDRDVEILEITAFADAARFHGSDS